MENDESKRSISAQEEKALFSRLSVQYSTDKKEAWSSILSKIDKTEPQKAKVVYLRPWVLGVAASVSLLMCFGIFAKFYTTTMHVKAGNIATHTLPDGSTVNINSVSKLSYAPYWWAISREVNLEGEAFFEVEKGQNFQVKSPQGTTQVLGTSFNIYARNQSYRVFCATGKVRVNTTNVNEVTLTPNQFVELVEGELVKQIDIKKKDEILSWREGRFIYNYTPLHKVLQDFERYYDTELIVRVEKIDEYFYTGFFQRSVTLQEALEIVSVSFDFKLEKKSDNTFIITEK